MRLRSAATGLVLLSTALGAVLGATPVRAQSRAAIAAEADKAVTAEHYCDALYFFLKLDDLQHDPKNVFNAAEVARAADDRAQALSLYQRVVVNDPGFSEVEAAKASVKELSAALLKGPGTSCPMAKARCGNGVLEPTEQCDDGNVGSGDGCSATCAREAVCGNGVVEAPELCDDANVVGGDGCSSTCKPESCGNGALDPGEMCDDGNVAGGDGCSPACKVEGCGNGVLDAGEVCDDGNRAPGDGCSMDCKKIERCGDGVVDVGERCDDGNVASDDGCSSTCRVEEGLGPASHAPDPAPKKSGGNTAAWAVTGTGGALVVVGTIATVAGVFAWFGAVFATVDRDNAATVVSSSTNASAYVSNTSDLAIASDNLNPRDLDGWNGWGRFATPIGFLGATAGLGTVVVGAVLFATGGGE